MAQAIDKFVYGLKKPLGHGATSKVYKGFNTETNEIVAVKVIQKQEQAGFAQRLYDEANILRKFDHPNIVKLINFYSDTDNYYFILEYCNGGDLAHFLKKNKLTEDNAKDFMIQLCKALKYIRDLDFVHRDLKPQNILLCSSEGPEGPVGVTIKLTDFNFSRKMKETDLAQTVCGSPLYMAPELLKTPNTAAPNGFTVKSDLWSLGLILYEMINGRSPFADSQNIVDLGHKIDNVTFEYNTRVSPECNDLLLKLLAKNPSDRIDWVDVFNHPWLNIDEPTFVAENPDLLWESAMPAARSKPIAISQNEPRKIRQSTGDIFDDYIPFGQQSTSSKGSRNGSSPPSQTRSGTFRPRSNPDRPSTLTDQILGIMTGSANMIKGAVDYIATTEPLPKLFSPQK